MGHPEPFHTDVLDHAHLKFVFALKPSSKSSRKMDNLARKKKSSNPEHRFPEFLSSEVLLSKYAAPSLWLPLQLLLAHEVSPTLAERDRRSW